MASNTVYCADCMYFNALINNEKIETGMASQCHTRGCRHYILKTTTVILVLNLGA